jgi:2-aminobenzoate-CoA ligase
VRDVDLLPSAHVDTFARDSLPPVSEWPDLLLDAVSHYPDRLNAGAALLDETIERHGTHRPAVFADDASWTYGELHDVVTRIAGVLAGSGVEPGSRVLLRSPNNAWLMATWLAVLRIGAIAVTTVPLLRKVELEPIVEIGNVQFAVVDHRLLADWNEVTTFSGRTIVIGGEQVDRLDVLAQAAEPFLDPVPTSADDVALIAFTSGTTGRPKATLHFHRDVLAIADTFSANLVKPNADDLFAGSPPIAFTFGLGGLVIFPMRVGAATVMLEQAGPPALVAAIEKYRVTCLFTAPTAYRAMLGMLDEHDISSLRRCVSAGEMLPASTWQRWRDATGLTLIDGIGSTEMLHIFISAADEDSAPGFTGKAVPGYAAAIVNEELEVQPPGTPGRLAVKGPTGCRYLRDDRQRVYVQGGWNITGDIYEMDERGRFRYLARADDMIVSSGYNIAAPEVETALLEHPDVLEAAVVGVPDPDRGMLVKAVVVMRELPTGDAVGATTLMLQNHVKATIAPYKYPRVIEFAPALPKTATGKLQRHRLKTLDNHEGNRGADS